MVVTDLVVIVMFICCYYTVFIVVIVIMMAVVIMTICRGMCGSRPGSGEDAGLVAVGGQQAQQGAPEVPKLLPAVLRQDALPDGLQGDVARHAANDLLHEAGEDLLQRRPPLTLHPTPRLARLDGRGTHTLNSAGMYSKSYLPIETCP